MSRPPEAAPALIYEDNDVIYLDGEVFDPDADGSAKVYRALLTQTGTDAPEPTELENNVGALVWTREGTGQYRGTLTGAFPTLKTFIPLGGIIQYLSPPSEDDVWLVADRANANSVTVFTTSGAGPADGYLNRFCFEVSVYP